MVVKEQVDARRQRYGQDEAIQLLDGMKKLIVAKGKNVTEINLQKERPDDAGLGKLLLGPTGNLRAPTMKIGKTVLVGFHAEAYEGIFGSE